MIMAGVDGSPGSRHALSWAASIAARRGCELLAVQVLDKEPNAGQAATARRAELEKWLEALPGSGKRVAEVVQGDPVNALSDIARAHGADLLALGRRGAGGFAGLHLGSVCHHLALNARLPLAIVPQTAVLSTNRLVVGSDGSAGATAAINFAAELGSWLQVPVTAVYSSECRATEGLSVERRTWRNVAEVEVRKWAEPIEKAHVPLDIRTYDDPDIHPVAALESALSDQSGSVAICGTTGLGGFKGMMLGRVPFQLIHHSAHVVIVVPEGS